MTTLHDAAILGATPAGFAAAFALAKAGKDAVVVATPPSAVACPLADWTGAELFHLSPLPSGLVRKAKAKPFKRLCYHDVVLERRAVYDPRRVVGYFLQAEGLTRALRAAARKAGAKVRTSATRPVIELGDDRVCISGTTEVEARLLIITADQPSEVLADLGMATRAPRPAPLLVAGLDVPTTARGDGVLHVVEEPERSEIGLFFMLGGRLHLRLVSSSPAAGTRAAELSAMVARLQEAGLIPAKLPLHRARGAVWHPPAGMALDLETHVTKRCLLAGTAGGFAEPVLGQTLHTSMSSALLAARAVGKALTVRDGHAALRNYPKAWRKELEKRLLRPAMPFGVLLPLVFANPKVVPRLSNTLLYAQHRSRG